MILQNLSPYIIYILCLFILLIGLYIKTFVSEKAKNKALINDISRITEEKELISAKYQKEMELIKKDHDLDIAKRKYQYESKRDAYNKFLIFLDKYNSSVGEELTAKFFPVVENFMKDYLNAKTQNKKSDVLSDFFKKSMELSKEAYSEYNKLKQETNVIRLCASDIVLKNLDELEEFTKENLEQAEVMMKRMPTLINANDQNFNQEYQDYIRSLGQKIVISKKYLIEFMKLDLNTI